MKILARCMIAILFGFFLGGCANLAYLPGQKAIGKLHTIGPNVLVNKLPAVDGQTILNDDQISTGSASSAYLRFFSGGFIQLDENTDPGFKLVWQQTNCMFIVFKHLVGQVYEETSPECSTNYQTAHASWKNHGTKFNISVGPQDSVMTVLDGEMELITPQSRMHGAGQQMVVSSAGVQSVRQLTQAELNKVTRWRDKFSNTPDTEAGGGGSRKDCHCAD